MKKPTLEQDRISLITTCWTDIVDAHEDSRSAESAAAKQSVISRYGTCIYRYLLGATRDANTAEELGQEFAFRFVRGDFRNANPNKGRFRDYLKSALRNLVNDYFRQQKKSAVVGLNGSEQLAHVECVDATDQEYQQHWRQALIAEAWSGLAQFEQRKSNCFYTVLKFKADNPEMNSNEAAAILSQQLGEVKTSDWVRQNLHRAREKFGELLVAAVRQTLSDDSPAAVEAELADLQLLKYVEVRNHQP